MTIQSRYKELARPVALELQRNFGLFPRHICLISGAPRSGTSALCEWLGRQRAVSVFSESRILIAVHGFMEEAFRFKNLDDDGEKITKLARRLVFEYYSSSRILLGKKLVVDKEPLEPIAFPSKEYAEFIINVKKLLPDVKLLFAIRDPIATVWSMSQRTWGESLAAPESQRFTLEEYAENWCSCAHLAAQLFSDKNTYIVQFGRLVNDPGNESRKIFNFLNIRNGFPFQSRQTHEIGFSNDERRKILQIVQPQLEELKCQGMTNLVQ
jgi:hypothetical protein